MKGYTTEFILQHSFFIDKEIIHIYMFEILEIYTIFKLG